VARVEAPAEGAGLEMAAMPLVEAQEAQVQAAAETSAIL